jgi:hypothetical protein
MSNRSARIAEEISREMGLTIANDVHRQTIHQDAYTDPARQQAKDKLQHIAYSELRNNNTLDGFLYGIDRKGVGIEPVKNKQDETYGIRFSYEGFTFKASEIGREFGYHSIAKNFSSSPEQSQSQQALYSQSQDTDGHHRSYSNENSTIGSLLGDLLTPIGQHPIDNDNTPPKKKKRKNRHYGRQQ